MADLIYYIKLSRCLYEPRHTAYKAIRGFSIFIARGRKKEIILRSDKPPPALEGNPLYVLLNDEAADFVLYYEIGRFVLFNRFLSAAEVRLSLSVFTIRNWEADYETKKRWNR